MGDALEKALADALLRRPHARRAEGTQPPTQKAILRILVVDDNDGDADLVAEYLMGITSVRFQIERAKRLKDAINAIAVSPPDIILLDLGLPDSTGTGTFERLRDTAAAIPMVVFTGQDDADVATTVIKAGAQDFLVKGSFDDDALVRTLRHAIERHRAQLDQLELVRRLADANDQLTRLANTDALTGVLNRRGLENALGELAKRAQRSPVRLVGMLVDCDDFKTINERDGHATGDIVLTGVAQAIASSLRSVDYVGRVGGDEFLVLLLDVGLWDALRVAERIRRAVRFPRNLEPEQGVTVSIGVAEVGLGTRFLSEVLAATQSSLRTSKRSGKNKVVVADHENASVSVDRDSLGARLATPGEVRVVTQPIVQLSDNTIVARELLARFESPGLTEPNDFFRVAQEADLLTAADLACVRACLRVGENLDARRLHLNIFPSTLLELATGDLIELFGPLLPRICLEISEKQSVPDPLILKRRLAPLRERGLTIAIDDVGVGQTSLEMLLVLEPDVVKIDGEFVAAATSQGLPSAARSITKLMRCVEHLGATAIAEGIETELQLDAITTFGVRLGQGFLWGSPQAT
jgi:diguanylate cyclase